MRQVSSADLLNQTADVARVLCQHQIFWQIILASRLNHAFAHSSVNSVGACDLKVLAAAGDWHCMGGGSTTSACMHPRVDILAQALAEYPGTPRVPVNGSRWRHPSNAK